MAPISRAKRYLTPYWQTLARRQRLWLIAALAIMLFAVLIMFDSRIVGSDDTTFISQTAPYHSVTDWVHDRYYNWSGRIVGEGVVYIFSNLPIVYWQVITIGMYSLFSGLVFCYYRLLTPIKQHAKLDVLALSASLALPYILDKSAFAEGILWVTGGMVYFWSLVIMLLSLYLPVRSMLMPSPKHTAWWMTAISLLCAIIVPLSSEQAGVTLVVCMFCLCITAFRIRPRHKLYITSLLTLSSISLAIGLRAPGNSARLHAETNTWLPDFYTAPLQGHINDSLRWILDALINHTGLVFVIIWLCLASLLFVRKRRSVVDNLLIILFISVSVISLGRGFDVLRYWTQFHATWHAETSFASNMSLLGIWYPALITIPYAAFRVLPGRAARLVAVTLVTCAYGTTVMMTLTPTMYASSWRSMLIPSMLIGLAAFVIVIHTWQHAIRNQKHMIYVMLVYSLSHYILQLSRMIAQR